MGLILFKIEKKEVMILGIIVLIIIIGYLLFKLIYKPKMSFMVEYTDVPAINDNLFFFKIDVHYRGYDVGDVKKIELAKDQAHIDFFVDIHYKDLKIPTNSLIIFKTENIYGTRYLDIESPKKASGKFLSEGDVVNGFEVYERIDQYFIDEFKSGKTGNLIDNLLEITDVVKTSLENKENKKLLDQSAGDLAIILENLREITDNPSVNRDIKSTIKHSSGTLKSLDEILRKKEMRETIDKAPESIKKTLDKIETMNESMDKVSKLMPDATKNMAIANTLITEANRNLNTINTKVPPIPPSLVDNAEKLIVKTDCFESEISKLISKRNVILRLIFGNPGKSFNVCARKGCTKKASGCATGQIKK